MVNNVMMFGPLYGRHAWQKCSKVHGETALDELIKPGRVEIEKTVVSDLGMFRNCIIPVYTAEPKNNDRPKLNVFNYPSASCNRSFDFYRFSQCYNKLQWDLEKDK